MFTKVLCTLAMTGITLRNNCRTHLIRVVVFQIEMTFFFFSFGGSSMLYLLGRYDNHSHSRTHEVIIFCFQENVFWLKIVNLRGCLVFFSVIVSTTTPRCVFLSTILYRTCLRYYVSQSSYTYFNDGCEKMIHANVRTVPIEFLNFDTLPSIA